MSYPNFLFPFLATIAAFLITALPCIAEDSRPPITPPGTMEVVSSASETDYPPFCITSPDGQADGFSVELLRATLHAVGMDVTFVTGPWTEVKNSLTTGKVQVLPLVGRTPEREEIFDFTFPYMTLHGTILVREGEEKIASVADLAGKEVAVMAGDNAEEFLRRSNLGAKIATTRTFEDALQELSEGKHDAIVIQKLLAYRLMSQMAVTNLRAVGPPLDDFVQSFCFAVREGDKALLSRLNEGLSLVMSDGTFRRLSAKWFGPEAGFSGRQRIIVGGDSDYPPYEYLDDNGEPTGYNVDLTRAIARQMGLDVTFRLGPWAEVRQGLARKEIDAVQGMFYSPDREDAFDFSPAHTVVTHSVVVRAGSPMPGSLADLGDRTILVMRGDIMHDAAVDQGYADHLLTVESQEEALRLLSEGQGDCALVARIPALYWIQKHGWKNLRVSPNAVQSPEYCYAVPDQNSWLLAQFSEGLAALKRTGEYRQIYSRWLGPYEKADPRLRDFLKPLLWIVAPILLLLIAIFVWSRTLQKKVQERTAELQFEIAERRQSQEALASSESGLLLALDAGRMGKWDWTLGESAMEWSEGVYRLLGYRPGEVEPSYHAFQRRVHPEDVQRQDEAFRKSMGRKHDYFCEFRVLLPDGSTPWIEARGRFLFDAQGHSEKTYGVLIDIDEKKRTEYELQKSKQAAEQATKAKSEFLANMSHEIRTPLNGLFGMLQVLQATPLQPDQAECIDIALESGNNLLKVLNDILDLSRIEAGKMVLEEQNFGPAKSVKDVMDIFAANARKKGVGLRCRLDPDFPAEVIGDEGRFRQVLFNLVGNAVKFTEKGEISVEGVARPSEADPGKLQVTFTVSDTGIGIPAPLLNTIFEPFTQVDGTHTRKYGGSGLGLGIVKRLVGLMRGEVFVESAVGRGTRVRFSLTVGKVGGREQDRQETAPGPAPLLPASLRILLAEDELVNRIALERLLKKYGHRVRTVTNGKECLQAVEEEDFDVIFMDIQMPEMDGMAASRLIRARQDAKRTVPIVALTAHAMRGDREKFLEAGMDDYVSKPFDIKGILALLEEMFPGNAQNTVIGDG